MLAATAVAARPTGPEMQIRMLVLAAIVAAADVQTFATGGADMLLFDSRAV